MSATSSQNQHPYPNGNGYGTVPVLFRLRNVQPKIFAASNSSADLSSSQPAAASSPPRPEPPTVSMAAAPAATGAWNGPPNAPPRSSSSTSNRIYNAAVGLLVLALLFLVIRNSQNANTRPHAQTDSQTQTPASSNTSSSNLANNSSDKKAAIEAGPNLVTNKNLASHPTDDKQMVVTTIQLKQQTSVASQKEDVAWSRPLELGPAAVKPSSEIASMSLPNLLEIEPEEDSTSTAFEPSPKQIASKPPVEPLMLQAPQVKPTRSGPSTVDGNQSTAAVPSENTALPSEDKILSTGLTLPIDYLIELHSKNTPNAPARPNEITPRAFPASYPTYVPAQVPGGLMPTQLPASGQLLTGQPYPPISPDYKPMTVPAYERNAEVNSMRTAAESTSTFLRQPNLKPSMHPAGQTISNGWNRYQGTVIQQPDASAAKQPYMPYVAPNQPSPGNLTGGSTGYPPSSN